MPRSKETKEQMRDKVINIYRSGNCYKAISEVLATQQPAERDVVHK